jgi:hypothetical protein
LFFNKKISMHTTWLDGRQEKDSGTGFSHS